MNIWEREEEQEEIEIIEPSEEEGKIISVKDGVAFISGLSPLKLEKCYTLRKRFERYGP